MKYDTQKFVTENAILTIMLPKFHKCLNDVVYKLLIRNCLVSAIIANLLERVERDMN